MVNLPLQRQVAVALRPGAPDVLEVRTESLAPLKAGEVLVRVEAVGLNHVESLVRTGTYAVQIPFPYAVGFEGAGVVVGTAPDVSIAAGTRVCWTAVFGSCATFVVASAAMLARLPEGLSFEDGGTLAHGAVTAAGLVRHWPVPAGSFAVVWGASGAVGSVLVALLAERGVNVIGIASGPRVDVAKAAGAVGVIDRACEDVREAVRAATQGRGAAVVFDPVGAATYRTSLEVLAPRGCLVNYGQLSGTLPTVELPDLMQAGSIFVTKYGPRAGLVGADDVRTVISEVLALAAKRHLTDATPLRFTLDQAVDAYRRLESNPQRKVLVIPHDS
jgi:NADPH2:quinone reductase